MSRFDSYVLAGLGLFLMVCNTVWVLLSDYPSHMNKDVIGAVMMVCFIVLAVVLISPKVYRWSLWMVVAGFIDTCVSMIPPLVNVIRTATEYTESILGAVTLIMMMVIVTGCMIYYTATYKETV